jgi:hypothetical protein
MIITASAYFPPYTRQHVRQSPQARLIQELGDFPPTQRLGEDVGQLVVGGNPFESNFLLKQEFIDDVEFSVDVTVFFPSGAVAADSDSRFVVGEDEGRLNNEKL